MTQPVALADVSIAWAELSKVIGVSLVVAVGLVTLFAVGIRMLSYGTGPGTGTVHTRKVGVAVAAALFAICACVAVYGIYLLIKK